MSPPTVTVPNGATPDRLRDVLPCSALAVCDADAHAASLRGWQQCYDQISAGTYDGRTWEIHLGDLRLFRESSSKALRQRGRAPVGMHNFAVCARPDIPAQFRSSPFDASGMLAMADGTELDLRTPAGFEAFGIDVTCQRLQALCGDRNGPRRWQDVIQTEGWKARQLCATLQAAFDEVERGGSLLLHRSARHILSGDILDQVVAILEAPLPWMPDRTAVTHSRIVSKAEDYVLSCSFESVSVAELCDHVGTSRRRLQYAFQNVMGIGPHQYLRAIRLCRVRRELKAKEGSPVGIQDIAAKWGFWHVGHFAREYRTMFGELPSETVRWRSRLSGAAASSYGCGASAVLLPNLDQGIALSD